MTKSVAIIGTRGYPSYYGGFETAVRKLAPWLADAGWAVTVYGRPEGVRSGDPQADDRIRSVLTRGLERKSLSTLSYGYTAVRHAAREAPDVALVMNVANGYWLPLLKRAGVPTVVNVDGIEWERAKWGSFAKRVFRGGARFTARHGDALVYDSREIARRWGEEFGRGGEFIPYGGDESAKELPIEPGLKHRGYVLMVARFVPENSVAEFLTAAEILAADFDVVIVGSSGYGGELDTRAEALAAASRNVRWLGHISDDLRLHSLWQHAGAYFHGHTVGGTNPALVQAMALGAPIVARDTAYNREVLADAGRLASGDPAHIAKAIRDVMSEPALAETLGRKSRARAAAEYSWDLVNSRYERVLAELAGVSPARSEAR